ncbi:MAG: S1 family peptidase [Burkholderiales bacterium]
MRNSVRSFRAAIGGMILLLAGFIWQHNAAAAGFPDTVQRVKKSIVAIGTERTDPFPETKFMGTGFAVGDGSYVITNAHVISVVLDPESKESLTVFVGKGQQAKPVKVEVVKIDHEHDLALLKMSGETLPALHFGNSDAVREGDSLAFTGFPIGIVLGLYPATHRATLSSITPIVIPAAHASDLNSKAIKKLLTPFSVFQLDGTAYPGNSGSPLYYPETGDVIGIVNLVFVKTTKENVLSQPSGIAYAIPGQYMVQLMRQAGVTP